MLVTLQANWMTDYRNSSGIVWRTAHRALVVTLEDSSRVDPWIVGQAQREAAACREALAEFARRDRPVTGGSAPRARPWYPRCPAGDPPPTGDQPLRAG